MKRNLKGQDIRRALFDIPAELHTRLKAHVAFKQTTMSRFTMQAIIEKLERDLQYQDVKEVTIQE